MRKKLLLLLTVVFIFGCSLFDKIKLEKQDCFSFNRFDKNIEHIQMPRAESDTAVAAASIIAREQFLLSLKSMKEKYKMKIPKGDDIFRFRYSLPV